MNARSAAILVVLLAVLGGGALLIYQQQHAQQASNIETLGQPLFAGLQAAEVAAIRIVEPGATLTLALKDARWTLAERGGFPADFAKVRDFVLKAIELKVGQSEPIGETDRARLALNQPGKDGAGALIEFRAADGKPLARLLVGKKHFKREPENPDKARGDGRFVMRPDSPKTALVVADPLSQASAKSALWIDKTAYAAEMVKTLEVRFPDGGGWRIERQGDGADWTLVGAKPAEKLEVTRANAAAYMMGQGSLTDVAPADAKPGDTGLDKPTLVTATTFDGPTYTLRVGKKAGDDYYVRIAIDGAPRKERVPQENESADDKTRRDREFAGRLNKLEERLPREKALADYVLLVPASKLEDLLMPRAEMLERKKP